MNQSATASPDTTGDDRDVRLDLPEHVQERDGSLLVRKIGWATETLKSSFFDHSAWLYQTEEPEGRADVLIQQIATERRQRRTGDGGKLERKMPRWPAIQRQRLTS